MGKNKQAFIRYRVLDQCFSNPYRHFFIKDLVLEISAVLHEHGYGSGVSERQVYDDIRFMESEQGWSIELETPARINRKRYYRYKDLKFSISNSPMGQKNVQVIEEAISILNEISGIPGFYWLNEALVRLSSYTETSDRKPLIAFSNNPYLKGLNFFPTIYKSIKNKQALRLIYKPFSHNTLSDLIIFPYFLKQYNERWFLFGLNSELNVISNLALDRIHKINLADEKWLENEFVDFEEYFDDVIGVTVNEDNPVKNVVIEISNDTWPYIHSKPLHGSQKILNKTDEAVTISLNVQINYELVSMILSFGSRLKVLEPEELVQIVMEEVKTIINR
jgi:predicted DNA-binding transcriptional regulator YafY